MDNFTIDLSDSTNNIDLSNSKNFGSGIELLMNEKKIDNKNNSSIDIEELNDLENELNELANEDINLNDNNNFDFDKPSVRFEDNSNLGKATFNTFNSNNTWDGFSSINNVPINPDVNYNEPKMTKEELLREKFKYLRKLEALEKKGVELTKKYNMESSLNEMQGEYEMIMEEKSKQNSVKFQANMLMSIINGIEFLNNRFDPFDIKLDGWGEQVNENINDYDDIFAELYEKYKSKASIAPELKLLFQLGGSAMMVHMTNTMFKSAMPGMDDILRQNPDLMRSFQNAALNTMGNNNPGFKGFMDNIVGDNMFPNSKSHGPPPPPIATQGPNAPQPPLNRGGNNSYNSRPDLNKNMNMNMNNNGINIRDNFAPNININEYPEPKQQSQRIQRSEMKGPSDISSILSGLKTKTINISEMKSNDNNSSSLSSSNINVKHLDDNITNNSSTISINDIKDIQGNANIPKKSRRKQKSEQNSVRLENLDF